MLLIVPPPASAGDEEERVAELILRAAAERDRGDHKAAAKRFAEADRLSGGGSIHAVAGLCQENLALGRWDGAVVAAERWVELARTPEERAGGRHYLGVALRQQGLQQRRAAWEDPAEADAAAAAEPVWRETLLHSAEELRNAAASVPENRHITLLHLADVLVHLREYREAVEVLDEYAAAGGVDDPLVDELRCWSERAAESAELSNEAEDGGDGDGAITPPRRLHGGPPQYTDHARRLGVQGTVILQAIIDRAGRVACTRVLRGVEPTLDRSALNAVKDWRFQPALREGEPVDFVYNLTVNFTIDRRVEARPFGF